MTRSLALSSISALLLLASTGGAAIPPVRDPLNATPCISPGAISGYLDDPNGFYHAAPSCKAMCKKAEGDCKQYVRLSFSCQTSWLADEISYEKKNCEAIYGAGTSDARTCKSGLDADAKADRLDFMAGRDQALTTCEDWDSTCESTCP